jgi:cytochrome bd-type quinol oxidase subunit 2
VTRLGNARALVILYAVLAIAATGRSAYQVATKFDSAPVAYSLSSLAAVVYIVATVALARGNRRVAVGAMVFELVGVLAIGSLTLVAPGLFPSDTVWSAFGAGYLYVPLALPVLGLLWLRRESTR